MSDRDKIFEQCSCSAVWEAFATFPLLIFVFNFIYTAHITLHLQYITHITTLATNHTVLKYFPSLYTSMCTKCYFILITDLNRARLLTYKHHFLGVSTQRGSRVDSAGSSTGRQ